MPMRNNQSQYDDRLAARAARGPMTAKEIAEIMGIEHAPTAIKRLRYRKRVKIEVVGQVPSKTRPCNLYAVELEK